MMDVIGNNIANVNTAGYKTASVVFQDLLSQVLRGAGAPVDDTGGTNPAQVGLGVRVAGISTSFGQGGAQVTGRSTDLSIQGDGFFVVSDPDGTPYLTRAGSFVPDATGDLVNAAGFKLLGYPITNGDINIVANGYSGLEVVNLESLALRANASTSGTFRGTRPSTSRSKSSMISGRRCLIHASRVVTLRPFFSVRTSGRSGYGLAFASS